MRLSAKVDYALRALLVLADHAPGLVKLDALAVEEAMPRKFVESILAELRRAGLVQSRRGADGGYGLAVSADRITVGDVLRVVDGPISATPPVPRGPVASGGGSAHLATVWAALDASMAGVLDATTLEHLISGRLPEHVERLAATEGPAGAGQAAPFHR